MFLRKITDRKQQSEVVATVISKNKNAPLKAYQITRKSDPSVLIRPLQQWRHCRLSGRINKSAGEGK